MPRGASLARPPFVNLSALGQELLGGSAIAPMWAEKTQNDTKKPLYGSLCFLCLALCW